MERLETRNKSLHEAVKDLKLKCDLLPCRDWNQVRKDFNISNVISDLFPVYCIDKVYCTIIAAIAILIEWPVKDIVSCPRLCPAFVNDLIDKFPASFVNHGWPLCRISSRRSPFFVADVWHFEDGQVCLQVFCYSVDPGLLCFEILRVHPLCDVLCPCQRI